MGLPRTLSLPFFRKRQAAPPTEDLVIKQLLEFQKAINKNKPAQKTLEQFEKEFQQYQFSQLRQICRHTPSIVNARIVLREHVFKNRYEWLPAFGSKCTNPECQAEFEQTTPTCDRCHAATREPDQKQQEKAERFFKDVNEYDQSIIEVLQQAEDEINMTDYASLWLDKEYTLNTLDPDGHMHIVTSQVTAIESIPPESIAHNLDGNGRHKSEFFCIQHREQTYNEDGYCPICGTELKQAWYCYSAAKSEKRYYAQDEIIDWHFYDPRGYSPVYAIMKSVLVEWGMDDELWERFWNKTLPKDIIAVITSNTAALDKVKKAIIEQAKNNEVPFVGIESQTGRGAVQKIPLTDDSVTDLTNIGTRDQIKKIINTVYGIVPLYAADAERSSALSGEGQQLLVQEDRAKAKQLGYNEKILPQLLDALQITDWRLQLKPPTEESEVKKLNIKSMKITNARGMLDMGFKVELDENGEFVFSGKASKPDMVAQSPFAASTSASIQKSVDEPVDESVNGTDKGNWTFTAEETLLVKARWEEVIEAIRQGTLWQDYYELTDLQTELVNSILAHHFIQPYVSLRAISEDLMKRLGLPEARADIIGRTEMSAVLNKARELDYVERDPEGEYKYKALNPVDARTTECCRRIVKRTAKGVPMAELKAIWKEESERFAAETKSNFHYVREFVAHFGCRTTFVRKV